MAQSHPKMVLGSSWPRCCRLLRLDWILPPGARWSSGSSRSGWRSDGRRPRSNGTGATRIGSDNQSERRGESRRAGAMSHERHPKQASVPPFVPPNGSRAPRSSDGSGSPAVVLRAAPARMLLPGACHACLRFRCRMDGPTPGLRPRIGRRSGRSGRDGYGEPCTGARGAAARGGYAPSSWRASAVPPGWQGRIGAWCGGHSRAEGVEPRCHSAASGND